MPILLDTHAWVWWVTDDRRLSARARKAVQTAQQRQQLGLSLISVWELATKVEKQQLVLDRPVSRWLDLATNQPGLTLWEMTRPILVESCALPQPFHGDPADQIIAATARLHEAVVVTRDERLRAYEHVRTTW